MDFEYNFNYFFLELYQWLSYFLQNQSLNSSDLIKYILENN
jgi:hypothetical protein